MKIEVWWPGEQVKLTSAAYLNLRSSQDKKFKWGQVETEVYWPTGQVLLFIYLAGVGVLIFLFWLQLGCSQDDVTA